jgi:hypothetical protein
MEGGNLIDLYGAGTMQAYRGQTQQQGGIVCLCVWRASRHKTLSSALRGLNIKARKRDLA